MKQFINVFKNEKLAYKILTILLMAFIAFLLFRIAKNTIVGLDYPSEELEPANVNLTNSILKGNVPYARENLVVPGQAEPPINFEYPFLHSLAAVMLSFVFGGNTVAAHYVVSFAAMVGTAVLGSIIIFKNSRTTVGATAGFLFLMFCHWRYGYISASPDGFGLFVALLTLYIACRPNVRYRALWCAIGTVAAFYSKQYYAAICVSIFVYFFCYSRKEALKYFLGCVIFLAASMIIVTWKWPLFWDYSVLLLMHGCFQGWGIEGFIYVLDQIKYLAAVFAGMIAVIAIAFVQMMKKRKGALEENGNAKLFAITEASALPLFLIQLPVQIVALFIFGRNDGAYLTYFLQLLIPSVVISTLLIMESMDYGKYERIFICVYGVIILCTTYFGWGKLPMHMLTQEEVANWERAYALIDEYRAHGDIYHNQVSAYNAMRNGDSVFGTGHDGDITAKNYEEWKASSFQQFLFPDAGDMYLENIEYRRVMLDRVNNHEIAMVITEGEGGACIDCADLERAGYYVLESIDLQLGNMAYNASFWVCE